MSLAAIAVVDYASPSSLPPDGGKIVLLELPICVTIDW